MDRTVGQLIDRVLRDWLLPPDAQPARFALSSGLDDSITTISINSTLLPPEASHILSPGVVVEVDREQILVGSYSPSTDQITGCIRGVNGTEATSHATGTLATISPPYSRQSLFDATSEAIANLYPPLYHVHRTTLTTAETPVELPSDFIMLQSALILTTSSRPIRGASLLLFNDYPAVDSNKAVLFENVNNNRTAHVTYRARPHVPSSESDLLFENLGVDPAWQHLLSVAIVAAFISGRDTSGMYLETLTQRMEAEHVQLTAPSQIQQALTRYYNRLVERASRHLISRDGMVMLRNGRFVT